jgi:hypothetical protein
MIPRSGLRYGRPIAHNPGMDQEHLGARLFLIAHDEFSGKPHIGHDLLACGLVGAVLADLVLAGRLTVDQGRVVVTDLSPSDTDDVTAYVLDSIRRQQSSHSVRTWTSNLGDPLHELIGRDLVARGILRREAGRGLLRARVDRFPAADLLRAAAPRIRLEHMIRHPREMDLPGGVVAALLWSLGVDRILDPTIDRTASRRLVDEVLDHLPPDLEQLLAGVTAAGAAVSLTVRR